MCILLVTAFSMLISLRNLCENADVCVTDAYGNIKYKDQLIPHNTKPNTTFYCYWEPPQTHPQAANCVNGKAFYVIGLVICTGMFFLVLTNSNQQS